MKTLNLNSNVRFILTSRGLVAYKSYIKAQCAKRLKLFGDKATREYEESMLGIIDETRYMEMQLSDVIKIFGYDYEDNYFENNSLYISDSEFGIYNDN